MADDAAPQRSTVSLPKDLYWRFQEEIARRRFSTINEAYADAIETWLRHQSDPRQPGASVQIREQILSEARTVLDSVSRLDNHYQNVLATWRLARTLRQIQAIGNRRLDLEAWPADIYLSKILSELMRALDGNDEYCTITNSSFWGGIDEDVKAADHPFLLAHEQAVDRGLRVSRIFLLEEGDVRRFAESRTTTDESDRTRRELERHWKFQTRMDVRFPGRVHTAFLFAKDLHQALSRYGHFALIRRWSEQNDSQDSRADLGCMIVEPNYGLTGMITNLRFIFSLGPGDSDPDTSFYIDRFAQARTLSEPIAGLFSDTLNDRRAP